MARITDIIAIASKITGCPERHILGELRNRNVCAVRAAIYMVARDQGLSFPVIGQHVGQRDHTTVMNAIESRRRFQQSFDCFDDFVAELGRLTRELPPFVVSAGWTSKRLFNLGRFPGKTEPAKAKPSATIAKRREIVTAAEAAEPVPIRLIKRRNDFLTDADEYEQRQASDIARGSEALRDAIFRAMAA